MPAISLDAPPCEGRPPTAYDDTEERLSDIYASQLLEYGKRTYSGVAKLGIEALELKTRGTAALISQGSTAPRPPMWGFGSPGRRPS